MLLWYSCLRPQMCTKQRVADLQCKQTSMHQHQGAYVINVSQELKIGTDFLFYKSSHNCSICIFFKFYLPAINSIGGSSRRSATPECTRRTVDTERPAPAVCTWNCHCMNPKRMSINAQHDIDSTTYIMCWMCALGIRYSMAHYRKRTTFNETIFPHNTNATRFIDKDSMKKSCRYHPAILCLCVTCT